MDPKMDRGLIEMDEADMAGVAKVNEFLSRPTKALEQVRDQFEQELSPEEVRANQGMYEKAEQARQKASQSEVEATGAVSISDDTIKHAVRASKRRRVSDGNSNIDLTSAHKVYVGGPSISLEDDNGFPPCNGAYVDDEFLGLPPTFTGALSTVKRDLNDKTLLNEMLSRTFVPAARSPSFSFIESLCSSTLLIVEVCKHLPPKDIVVLYSISKTFHATTNTYFKSSIKAWADHMAPSGSRIFHWRFYRDLTIPDPSGVTNLAPGPFDSCFPHPVWAKPHVDHPSDNETRIVPSFKYLAMVAARETQVRDIVACLARSGHRLPLTAHKTLKKIWLLMEMPTNRGREMFIRNKKLWTRNDLYNAQMFFFKLNMRFNEPIFGPDSPMLLQVLLGQRTGLYKMWQMFRRKDLTKLIDLVRMKVRYFYRLDIGQRIQGQSIYDVPFHEVGIGHLEGWGAGKVHLYRPDELVIMESVRRDIDMTTHLLFMAIWGHIDIRTGENLVPTEEEMYMSDDELPPLRLSKDSTEALVGGKCGNVPFEYGEWQPKHAKKARWHTLTDEEKHAINAHDDDEVLQSLRWEEYSDYWSSDASESDETPMPRKVSREGPLPKPPAPAAEELDENELESAYYDNMWRGSNNPHPPPVNDHDDEDLAEPDNPVNQPPPATATVLEPTPEPEAIMMSIPDAIKPMDFDEARLDATLQELEEKYAQVSIADKQGSDSSELTDEELKELALENLDSDEEEFDLGEFTRHLEIAGDGDNDENDGDDEHEDMSVGSDDNDGDDDNDNGEDDDMMELGTVEPTVEPAVVEPVDEPEVVNVRGKLFVRTPDRVPMKHRDFLKF